MRECELLILISAIDLQRQCRFRNYNLIACLGLIFVGIVIAVNERDVNEYCSINDDCEEQLLITRYVLYDINPAEGFNLRRDVYMRMAIFMREYGRKQHENWHLVLPPWNQLYHWRSKGDVDTEVQLFWDLFFDVPSLQAFSPVVEMHNFLKDTGQGPIDNIFILQHHQDILKQNEIIDWSPKWKQDLCNQEDRYSHYIKTDNDNYKVQLWGYKNLTAKDIQCISFHGEASLLGEILLQYNPRTVIFDHAEIPLHNQFGDATYWECRRSMRFNKDLVAIALHFRMSFFNSTDAKDNTLRPEDWRLEKEHRSAIGGPYLAVHLRRRDFLYGRKDTVPSLKSAAKQIERKLLEHGLDSVFIATDAPESEYIELKTLLNEYKVFRYTPVNDVKLIYKDGGIAIIDQIICSHARYFIGTHESTFSFRIQEEREILGFNPDTTFNCFCSKVKSKCQQPSKWKIVY